MLASLYEAMGGVDMLRLRDYVRGPGGRRLLRLEAWKAATRTASLAMVDWKGAALERMEDTGEAVAARRVAAAARAVCLNSVGRMAEAIVNAWLGMRGFGKKGKQAAGSRSPNQSINHPRGLARVSRGLIGDAVLWERSTLVLEGVWKCRWIAEAWYSTSSAPVKSIKTRYLEINPPAIAMSSRVLNTASSLSRSMLCRTCLLRSIAANRQHRRPLHLSTIAKREAAQEAWKQKAERIKNGEETNLWDSFKERGYVKDIAGTDNGIRELMRQKRIGVYVGIDPTAASLHLGHLLPLMPLFWMYMNGYRAISLIGGATAKVGDPTGRLTTRDEVARAERSMYTTKIHYQLKRIWMNVEKQAARYGYQKEWAWNRELANNSSWYNSTPFLEVVNRLFKGMRVGPMLSRETVKRKMTEGDGMSLAEFVYPMMQAWDWWEMFSGPKQVCMQIGGSDQYGNIVAGIDAVKLLRDTEPDPEKKLPNNLLHTPVGFTVPLLTDSAGNKFGKSAGNAMWLDPFMTNSFDLYGYFMRRPDDEIEKLLKLFTFLPLEDIKKTMDQHNLDPPKRHAHHTLAFEVLSLVHSDQEARATRERHMQMFSKGGSLPVSPLSSEGTTTFPDHLSPKTHEAALHFKPNIQLPESLIMGQSIAKILYAAGLAESSNDAHRLIAHQGAYPSNQ
ncbi:hypothetical protein NPX13_g11295 [Xylaria arbuscula]|uniref:Tyrosine--tRNA ligase n=1 Tax=Xylaria arbuscula TaxID=114810 RepID=A0A9W8N327_9PEZI|nr:hypothetical protein NPX13_g11295 [Xylaria arbuscula]